jgi:RNA methyltransferase, TrmH family
VKKYPPSPRDQNKREREFNNQDRRSPRPHLDKNELRYGGKNACLALFKFRPDDIIRVYVRKDLSETFAELLGYCSRKRKAYHLVTEAELDKLTDSLHHEGICIVGERKRVWNEKRMLDQLDGRPTPLLFLDGVANPHNFGAIIRSAAHFGLRFICGESLPPLSAAVARTAEGGMEVVEAVRIEDIEAFLDRIKKSGFVVYCLDLEQKAKSLFETRINEKSCFILGHEVSGVSGVAKSNADVVVKVPGTGTIQSLNVSVTAALAMGEFFRQRNSLPNSRIVKR